MKLNLCNLVADWVSATPGQAEVRRVTWRGEGAQLLGLRERNGWVQPSRTRAKLRGAGSRLRQGKRRGGKSGRARARRCCGRAWRSWAQARCNQSGHNAAGRVRDGVGCTCAFVPPGSPPQSASVTAMASAANGSASGQDPGPCRLETLEPHLGKLLTYSSPLSGRGSGCCEGSCARLDPKESPEPPQPPWRPRGPGASTWPWCEPPPPRCEPPCS